MRPSPPAVAERPTRLDLVVPPAAVGTRLDRFLATAPEIGTRARAQHLIADGRVQVGGVARKPAHVLRRGERLTIVLPPPEPLAVEAEPLPLRVLYEDAALLAIDKPPGLVVHPAAGIRRGTLVNALVHRLGALPGVGEAERPGLVHRLDRDTSGVLLVARTAAALEALARQFRERTIEKRYLAIVHGRVPAASGTIDRPIGRHPRERKRMSVHSRRGRSARTRWTVIERLPGATVLRLAPETGRTHQLRVHLAALGHPVIGDRVYGGRHRRGTGAVPGCARQALHAEEIRFAHPVSGERIIVRAPVPEDLQQLRATLRQAGRRSTESPRSA
jgi:23S rRNA pseudouridine1911/1915/1917 synthase